MALFILWSSLYNRMLCDIIKKQQQCQVYHLRREF